MATQKSKHTWSFFRTGGLDQVHLRSGKDIECLSELDQKLWTALSCPVQGVHFDGPTMQLLDTDKDGRVRVPEVLQAVAWLKARLKSLEPLTVGSEAVKLADIADGTPEGEALLASTKRILENLNKSEAEQITLTDVTDTAKIFAATEFNGDGIITADATDNPAVSATINQIIETFGAETDRNGKPGINQEKCDAFFQAAEEYLAWSAQTKSDPDILTLGSDTAAAFEAFKAMRAKVDDYFTRCSLAAFDSRAATSLAAQNEGFCALAAQELSMTTPEMAAFPLAAIKGGQELPLLEGVNPFWAGALAELHEKVVKPLCGADQTTLTAADWVKIKARLAPFEAWSGAECGAQVAGLGVERLQELVDGSDKASISELIAHDAALEAENAQIVEVEQLIRYHAHLGHLLQNYVNMAQLYNPDATAIFQIGTLYMDARACELCFHVADVGAHAELSAASKCCLIYCKLTRDGSAETRTICAAFTAGFAQNLWVGRNGIFYDLAGRDWDATIVKVVENPISIKEAFWSPWRKIADMIGAQVNKLLAAREDAALAAASSRVEAAAASAAAPTAPDAPKKMEGAALASSVAALGIAVGLIASAVGGLVSVVVGLPLWKLLLGIVAIILVISCPSMVIAAFKLRARDLAPILNACGWAINRRLRFSLRLGRLFTREALLPEGAVRELRDPYADKNGLRNTVIVVVIVAVLAALWFKGVLDGILPDEVKRTPPPAAAVAAEATAPAAATE